MSQNLEPGTTIPDFVLPDENGDLHRLSDLQGDNALVLHLSRGEHCPRERMQGRPRRPAPPDQGRLRPDHPAARAAWMEAMPAHV
jgi:hypothetical protein